MDMGFLFGVRKMFLNEIVVTVAQLCEYTEKKITELYITLKG